MSPAIKHRHFAMIVKFIMLICLSIIIAFAFFKGNIIVKGIAFFFIISIGLIYIWRRRHSRSSEYDEVGYWSGLDDFELGIDYHCFHDLGLPDEDEIDLFSDDFYDSRPV